MAKTQQDIIVSMKQGLMHGVEEWLGSDIPDEGSEDHQQWMWKVESIKAIATIEDVTSYLDGEQMDEEDFFVSGDFDLIAAGMDPGDVPSQVVTDLGLEVASQTWSGGSWVNVYEYGGKYFTINEAEMTVFDSEEQALKSAGIDDDTYDKITETSRIKSTQTAVKREAKSEKTTDNKIAVKDSRPVLLVVTQWPDGTMAMKFGYALRAALQVTKDEMTLVQMKPERIFRVETSVSEEVFREAMSAKGVSCHGKVLFIEL